MGWYNKVYNGRSPMQNHSDSGTPRFSTPQSNMDVSSHEIVIKVPKYTKTWNKITVSSTLCFVSIISSIP